MADDDILTEAYDFLQLGVAKFADLVALLADHLQDQEVASVIMADLGLDPDSGEQLILPQQNVASIQAYLDQSDPGLDALIAVIEDIAAVTEAIVSFVEVAGGDPTTEEGLRELAYELLLLANLHHYRYRFPAAVAIGELLGVVNFNLENYEVPKVLFAPLRRLLRELDEAIDLSPVFKLSNPVSLQTEEDARTISDLVLIGIVGLLLLFLEYEETTEVLGLEKPRKSKFETEILYGWDILDPEVPTPVEIISNRMLSLNLTAKFSPGDEDLFEPPSGPPVAGDLDHLGEVDRDLDNRTIHPSLRSAFENASQPLSGGEVVAIKKVGRRWHIVDTQTYVITRAGDKLQVSLRPPKAELTSSLGLVLVPKDDGGPGLMLAVGGGGKLTIPINTDWTLTYDGKASTGAAFFISTVDASESQVFGPSGAGLSVEFARKNKHLERRAALPKLDGSALSFGGFKIGFAVANNKLDLRAVSTDNILVISSEGRDSFVRESLPTGEIRAEFGIGLVYDVVEQKLRFAEGTKLRAVIPLAKSFLGVQIIYLTVEMAPNETGDALRLEVSASISVRWGPFTTAIDRIGIEANLPPPADEDDERDWGDALTLKPPSGVGFAVDASPGLSGGGFLFYDRDLEEYAGVVNLVLGGKIDLKVIGLISTNIPDSDAGFSLLAIGSIESKRGVNLFLNFTVHGIGLLLGVNRSMLLDAVQSGVRSGSIDNLLFPQDPVLNAPKIISDLRTIFPPTDNRHVAGLLMSMSWSGQTKQYRMKIGVIVELPPPVKLALLGQLEITLPTQNSPIVNVKADFAGIWDQAQKSISFDAALRDSKVGEFPLTGEMAARGNWGRNRVFIIAIGGVHPGFNPPAALPAVRRVQIAVGSGDNPRLRMEGYIAITANTAQAGVRAELHARKSGFTLEGWAGIDALFQFDPFKIEVDFSAGVEIRRGSRILFSLTLKAKLEAFSPVRISGKVKFKIFWVSFSIPVNLTLGRPLEVAAAVVNVLTELEKALNDPVSWAGELPEGREMMVTLDDAPPGDGVMVHPAAALNVSQQVVPLGVEIQLFNNARPSGATKFEITSTTVNGESVDRTDVPDYFAPAQFLEMSDEEKLARPSFEEMPAGATLGDAAIAHGGAISADLTYETILVDRKEGRVVQLEDYVMGQDVLFAAATFGAASEAPTQTTGPAKHRGSKLGIKVAEPAYVVAGVDDLAPVTEFRGTYTGALAQLRSRLTDHPAEVDRLQVVGIHEGLEA